jgi:hypothetical protein
MDQKHLRRMDLSCQGDQLLGPGEVRHTGLRVIR